MKLLINASTLAPPRTGIGQYTKNLISAFLDMNELDSIVGFNFGRIIDAETLRSLTSETLSYPITSGGVERWFPRVAKAIARNYSFIYHVRHSLRSYYESRSIEPYMKNGYIYHETNTIPVRTTGKRVVTVHDLSQLRSPSYHPSGRVSFLNKNLPFVLKNVDRIITVSNFSAREIIDVYGVPVEKVKVTYLAAEKIFRPRELVEVYNTLRLYRLQYKKFILSVATLEPRKNLMRLIAAHKSLPENIRKNYPLVLCGASGWRNADVLRVISKAERNNEVMRTGYLSRTALAELFSSAAVLAYPSLYEGFGMPVLEGFASGTAVLTSNLTSMPEISMGAAIEVDPHSIDALRDGLLRLLEDQTLMDECIRKGFTRSNSFSWYKCAKDTLSVYREII
ncbi:glycosyltransferase family 1 protein [Candidatus Igneacidithiobacillus taiwanensis]|uniref:glycosyltransferase family 4 protein n=1 Tax=Candidatus Igneacidithiobacillus taiwanensis TaxID=1945924 RepID=UPI0028A2108D|nr:glycosyltransferase family 1 protein [Candidatus Igneacidithiobacillus taiwanensis]